MPNTPVKWYPVIGIIEIIERYSIHNMTTILLIEVTNTTFQNSAVWPGALFAVSAIAYVISRMLPQPGGD